MLVPGEDLTPYRKTSASIFSVLSKFGSAAQKLGMDEVLHVHPCYNVRHIAEWRPRLRVFGRSLRGWLGRRSVSEPAESVL